MAAETTSRTVSREVLEDRWKMLMRSVARFPERVRHLIDRSWAARMPMRPV